MSAGLSGKSVGPFSGQTNRGRTRGNQLQWVIKLINVENVCSDTKRGSGYLLVDPVLSAGGEDIPLDCVQCVTYLSKLLGPLDTWEGKLRVAKESGYNMIHFTPIQELGGSHSAYSLQNQLALNPVFAVNNHMPDIAQVQTLVDKLRQEWKVQIYNRLPSLVTSLPINLYINQLK